MRARSNDAHRMTLNQRCVLWLLGAVERWGAFRCFRVARGGTSFARVSIELRRACTLAFMITVSSGNGCSPML